MNADEFKQQIEKYAELKQVKTPKSPAIRENDEPEVIYRGGEEFSVDVDNNPTLTWAVKKLKPHVAVCEDCCQVVENRRIEIQRYSNPIPHWRRHCTGCDKGMNPYTGKYELANKLTHHYNACFLEDKPEPNPYSEREEKSSDLRPVYKKPAK